jgi:hypothetical protein
MSFFVARKISRTEARRWLGGMTVDGHITSVMVEGEKDPHYLLAEDMVLLATVNDGHTPDAWQPLDTTTQ